MDSIIIDALDERIEITKQQVKECFHLLNKTTFEDIKKLINHIIALHDNNIEFYKEIKRQLTQTV